MSAHNLAGTKALFHKLFIGTVLCVFLCSASGQVRGQDIDEEEPAAGHDLKPGAGSEMVEIRERNLQNYLRQVEKARKLSIPAANVRYFNDAVIEQRYAPTQNGPAAIDRVELLYSVDGMSWTPGAADIEQTGLLNFRLPAEGEYAIKVVTTDKAGNRSDTWIDPATRFMFVLDTTAPLVKLTTMPADNSDVQPEDLITLQWSASDTHLPASPVRVEYSFDPSEEWLTLCENQTPDGGYSFRVPRHADRKEPYFLRFRAVVEDWAGNTQTEYLGRGFRIIPANIGSPPAEEQNVVRDVDGYPLDPLPPMDLSGVTNRVNRSNFNINYSLKNVGESGVKYVELWYTSDRGHTWVYYGRDSDKESPFNFKAPEDGVYAFYLLIENNAGARKGKRPMSDWFPEEAAQSLTLVDTAAPFVSLTTPRGGENWRGFERNYVEFKAYDRNLTGLDLYVSDDSGKTWRVQQKNIPNNGRCKLPTTELNSNTLRVKIIATDAVGNWTSEESERDFAVDNRVPDIEIKQVDTQNTGVRVAPAGTNNGGTADNTRSEGAPNADLGHNTVKIGKNNTPEYMLEARKAYERGIAFRARKEYSQARDMFNRAIEIDPRFDGAYYELGYLRLLDGDLENAKEQMWQAIQLNDKAVYRAGLAKALYQEKDWASALVQLHRVSEMEEKRAGSLALDAMWYMAKIYAIQQDYISATDTLRAIIAVNDPPSHYRESAQRLVDSYAKPLAEQIKRQEEEKEATK